MAQSPFRPQRRERGMRSVKIPLPTPENKGLRIFIFNHLKQQDIARDQIWVDRYNNKVVINGNEAEVAERKELIINLIEIYIKEQEMRNSTEGKIKVGIPKEIMRLVIGTHFYNIKHIEQKTGAKVDVIDSEFYVSGTEEQCKKAIKKLKISARNKMFSHYSKKQFPCHTYNYVSLSGCYYKLEKVDLPNASWPQSENYFKISMDDDDSEEEKENSSDKIDMNEQGLNKFVKRVLGDVQTSKDTNNKTSRSDSWLHFGHLFVSGRNVDEADQEKHFEIDQFQEQFTRQNHSADQMWTICFDSAIQKMEVDALKEALTGSETSVHNIDVLPPHTRYDIALLTPSCNRIRIKMFIDPDGQSMVSKEFLERFTDLLFDVRPIQPSSSAQYLLCDPFCYRAKISIAIPSRSMDVRMNIRQIPMKTPEELEQLKKEEDVLIREYLDKIVIKDGEVILPDKMPYDFCLDFFRKCERRSYCYDNGEQNFRIVISEEEEIVTENDDERHEMKTDIQIKSVEINDLLISGDWEPDDIIAKLPTFLSEVKDIQANISTSEETTDE